ncbi:MAG: pyridoxal phosphate-dependent aminotransferase [Silicimonas sp.]|nr:pyridoxal phosphate-dependent aminotransferase [Silicimonas sp.]
MPISELHLASRTKGIAPSSMMRLAAEAAELRRQGRDIIGLSTGEPDLDTPLHIQEAAVAAMRAGDTHYTDIDGTLALKEAIQRKFDRENGLKFKIEEISVSAGAKQVIYNAFAATIDKGDEVIVPTPYYSPYIDMARMLGGQEKIVTTSANNDFKMRAEDLQAAITDRTRWLVLNSPSNPSGTVYSASELAELSDVLEKHPNVWVLSDDIYEHILFDGQFVTMAMARPSIAGRTLTVNGVSKAYCMTGWRIGYAGGPKELIKAMRTIQSQVTTCPPSINQAAAVAALDGPEDVLAEIRSVFLERRDVVVGGLNAVPGIDCPIPEGTFYAFPSCEGLLGQNTQTQTIANDLDFARYLLDAANVVVVPGSAFGVPNRLRISFAADIAQLTEACNRIAAAVGDLK